jgi:hypothetical protein
LLGDVLNLGPRPYPVCGRRREQVFDQQPLETAPAPLPRISGTIKTPIFAPADRNEPPPVVTRPGRRGSIDLSPWAER